MTRARELPFELRLGGVRANWVAVDVRVGEHTERVDASGVGGDPVGELAGLGVLAASGQDGEHAASLWTEPDGWWVVARVASDEAVVELVYTPSMHDGLPRARHRDPGRVVARVEVPRLALAEVVWRALRAVEHEVRAAHAARAWAHAYPATEVGALAASLERRR